MAGQLSNSAPSQTLLAVTAGCPSTIKLKLLWPDKAVPFLLTLINAALVIPGGTVHEYTLLVEGTLLSIVVQLPPLLSEYSIVKLLASLP